LPSNLSLSEALERCTAAPQFLMGIYDHWFQGGNVVPPSLAYEVTGDHFDEDFDDFWRELLQNAEIEERIE